MGDINMLTLAWNGFSLESNGFKSEEAYLLSSCCQPI